MNPTVGAYLELEQRFAEWALTQPVIHAVLVAGSRARTDHPADEWSDLDLIVFADDVSTYLDRADWLGVFGDVWVSMSNPFGSHDREWLALYDGGLKIDVAFLTIDPAAAPTLQDMLDAFPYPVVLQRGVRVLLDKSASASTEPLNLPVEAPAFLPTQAEFTTLISRLLLDAVKAAKFIRRRDLWRAKQMCDSELKQHLLHLVEWQAAAQQDKCDIWYDGRFLNEWADERAPAALPSTFAAYEAIDLRRALIATLELAQWLIEEIAQLLGYSYSHEAEQHVLDHIHTLVTAKTPQHQTRI